MLNLSYGNEFYLHVKKSHFYTKGCVPRFALKRGPRQLRNGLFVFTILKSEFLSRKYLVLPYFFFSSLKTSLFRK